MKVQPTTPTNFTFTRNKAQEPNNKDEQRKESPENGPQKDQSDSEDAEKTVGVTLDVWV